MDKDAKWILAVCAIIAAIVLVYLIFIRKAKAQEPPPPPPTDPGDPPADPTPPPADPITPPDQPIPPIVPIDPAQQRITFSIHYVNGLPCTGASVKVTCASQIYTGFTDNNGAYTVDLPGGLPFTFLILKTGTSGLGGSSTGYPSGAHTLSYIIR